jgi:hypothetical protein
MNEHYDQREDMYKAQKDVFPGIEAYIAENANNKKGGFVSMNDPDYLEYNGLMLQRSRLITQIGDLSSHLDLIDKRLDELSGKYKEKAPD